MPESDGRSVREQLGVNMSKSSLTAVAIYVAAALFTSASATAAVQVVDNNGILTGATGIDVGGVSYDVEFLDGSCSALFTGCDEPSDFAFNNLAAAVIASQALRDQVFLGTYDAQPALTRGCSANPCYSFTPFEYLSPSPNNGAIALFASLENSETESNDGRFLLNGNGSIGINNDLAAQPNFTFARFTVSGATAAVPEPSTWAMMIMGFGATGFALRRRRRTATYLRTA